jgi:2-oxoglutarate dehydrogenase E1 component
VAESLNLQAIDGYKVGGTLHLIQNNQVGFTTDPEDSRSTRWASDLAKGYDTPIIHVNADDVAGCISAVRLAFAFRQEFGHDVVIDLIGYRRFGHNEADEPAYTQPEMYAKIKNKKRSAEIWAEKLVETGIVTQEEVENQRQEVWDRLTELHQTLKAQIKAAEDAGTVEHATGEYQLDRSPSRRGQDRPCRPTGCARSTTSCCARPRASPCIPKLIKQLERRREAVGPDGGIDWGHASSSPTRRC